MRKLIRLADILQKIGWPWNGDSMVNVGDSLGEGPGGEENVVSRGAAPSGYLPAGPFG